MSASDLQSGVSSHIARQFASDEVNNLQWSGMRKIFSFLVPITLPVVNVIIFLKRTFRFLNQLGNARSEMIAHLRVRLVRGIVVLEAL